MMHTWDLVRLTLSAIAGYFAGSIPFGYLIGKFVKGVDLRDHGSGNIGATNAGRVLGKKWGLICLILDAIKGLFPVAFLPSLLFLSDERWFVHDRVLVGVATIVGHMFPCWLGFRGGKGVATSLGVLLMLSPWGVAFAAFLFFGSILVWRYVSLSSMLAAIGFGIFELTRLTPSPFSETTWSQGAFAIMVPLLIIIQHRTNIRRLLKGEELPFARAKTATNESAKTSDGD
jgi:glycerol-3-phosphate acyltransferase PlsY